jgi:hypothetical protein
MFTNDVAQAGITFIFLAGKSPLGKEERKKDECK